MSPCHRRLDDGLTTNLFAYNLRSELTSAHMSTNLYAYTYDPIGNRLSATENGATTTYAANELNQYTALNPASPNPTPFTYDPDGNMTSDGTWSYAWDAENRLIEVQPLVTNLDSTLLQFMYDAQSRRIARREFAWMAFLHDDPAWRYVQGRAYRYDGWNLLQEQKPATVPRTPHPYISQTNLALTGIGGPVAASYLWGLDLSSTLQGAGGIGGLLASTLSGTNFFYISNANGNMADLMDEDGIPAAHYEYDSYGNTTTQSGTQIVANPFRFSSKHLDDEPGLYYFGFRFYSPEMGRWICRDPVGDELFFTTHSRILAADFIDAKRSQANTAPYQFIENSPISQVDLLGLACINVDSKCTAEMLKGFNYKTESGSKLSHLSGTICGIDGIYMPKNLSGGCDILKVPDWGTINVTCDKCEVSVGGWWWGGIPTWIRCHHKENKLGLGWCPGWYPRSDGCKKPAGWPDCP